jgi:hypothetical protein
MIGCTSGGAVAPPWHSFTSACAIKGVDQRLVQEWAGHMNEATSKRYRRLYPSKQQESIKAVFSDVP